MDIVRDLRHKRKYIVDDEYIDTYAKYCGIYATGVYNSLCRHANKEQYCFPSKKYIAKELKISEKKVFDAIIILKKMNMIKVESGGKREGGTFKSNSYTLLDVSQWEKIPSAGGALGTESSTPQVSGAKNHEYEVPNKETNNKGNTNKETQNISEELIKSAIQMLKEMQNIEFLDDEKNQGRYVKSVIYKIRREMYRDGEEVTEIDMDMIKPLNVLLTKIQQLSQFDWDNMTSFAYLDKHFYKIVRKVFNDN
jgi:hypothetical protein